MLNRNSLARTQRLRKKRDFADVSQNADRFVLRHLILLIKKKTSATPRLGITVSKNFGGATKRNRIKRLIREFFRCNKANFTYLDIHFIARPSRRAKTKEQYETELQKDFLTAIKEAGKYS